MLEIVSGGQTGVDRAALDTALALGLKVSGWCPAGRRAEDGQLDARYPLSETAERDYLQRTRWNVRDSDGTLILGSIEDSPGTDATAEVAKEHDRPLLVLDWSEEGAVSIAIQWIEVHGIVKLNIAGPRESESPGAYQRTARLLNKLFSSLNQAVME